MTFLTMTTLKGERIPTQVVVFFTMTIVAFAQLFASPLIKHSFTLGILFSEVVIIAGIPLLLTKLFKTPFQLLFPFRTPSLRLVILSSLLIIGLDIVIDYATFISELFFPLPQTYQEELKKLLTVQTSGEIVWKFFLLCLLPGVCEEIFFRGFCQRIFTFQFKPRIALLLTAFLFALLHGNPWYFHLYFLLGLALSWVFHMTQTLWIPILCHTLNNSWTFFHAIGNTTPPLYSSINVIDILLFAFGLILLIFSGFFLKKERTRPSL